MVEITTIRPGITMLPMGHYRRVYNGSRILHNRFLDVLVAHLFRPLNLGVQERVKKGELFLVQMILFSWPAALTTALAPRCKERHLKTYYVR